MLLRVERCPADGYGAGMVLEVERSHPEDAAMPNLLHPVHPKTVLSPQTQ